MFMPLLGIAGTLQAQARLRAVIAGRNGATCGAGYSGADGLLNWTRRMEGDPRCCRHARVGPYLLASESMNTCSGAAAEDYESSLRCAGASARSGLGPCTQTFA